MTDAHLALPASTSLDHASPDDLRAAFEDAVTRLQSAEADRDQAAAEAEAARAEIERERQAHAATQAALDKARRAEARKPGKAAAAPAPLPLEERLVEVEVIAGEVHLDGGVVSVGDRGPLPEAEAQRLVELGFVRRL